MLPHGATTRDTFVIIYMYLEQDGDCPKDGRFKIFLNEHKI